MRLDVPVAFLCDRADSYPAATLESHKRVWLHTDRPPQMSAPGDHAAALDIAFNSLLAHVLARVAMDRACEALRLHSRDAVKVSSLLFRIQFFRRGRWVLAGFTDSPPSLSA
jgi:hypothetical protein